MLFTSEGKPVFEPNAYILSRRIVEGTKDVKPTCFHLLRYYRYLDANNLNWDDHEERLQRYPIFLYRAYLDNEIEKGNLSRSPFDCEAFLPVLLPSWVHLSIAF